MATKRNREINLPTLDELFSTQAERDDFPRKSLSQSLANLYRKLLNIYFNCVMINLYKCICERNVKSQRYIHLTII